MQGITPNELAIAPHLPDLTQKAAGEALPARPTAEDHNVPAEKSRARCELDCCLTPKTRAVEENCLEWQKFECCAGCNRQRLPNRRDRAERSVDLFRRRRRDMGRGTSGKADADIEPVA